MTYHKVLHDGMLTWGICSAIDIIYDGTTDWHGDCMAATY